MQLPVAWLREFIDLDLSLKDLCERLTMAGLEVEGLEGEGDGAIIEVNVTPNRPDWLSVFGIARELGAILGRPVKPPQHDLDEAGDPAEVSVEIEDPDLCPRYAARVVRGVKVVPSPSWLAERIESVGIRPINNVVDATNYVLMELGHPMHAFDLDRLHEKRILVRRASAGTKVVTLDGVERKLDSEMLTICDGSGPVAVAGVMGGAQSEVSDETRDVLLEAAYFFPASVRRTSRVLGLRSESSYRFERGTDIEGLLIAMDRAAALIAELSGGRVAPGRIDRYPKPFISPRIGLNPERVNRLLGLDVPDSQIEDHLLRLGFEVGPGEPEGRSGPPGFIVQPPSFRRDVDRDVDLVEEVARLHGYHRIPSTLPGGGAETEGGSGRLRTMEGRIRSVLQGAGFSEAIHYSFMNPEHLDALGLAVDDERRNVVLLDNPLRAEEAGLRTTLLPALLESLGRNLRNGVNGVRIFEFSRVFVEEAPKSLPREMKRLAGVYSPSLAKTIYPAGAHGFFSLKGALEALAGALRVPEFRMTASEAEPFLDPAVAADVWVDGNRIGYAGAVSRLVRKAFDELEGEVFVFEIDVDALIKAVPDKTLFSHWPRFPGVDRDMAFLVPVERSASEILDAVHAFGDPLIASVRVFDVYAGEGIPDGMKSLAYSVRYLSAERTLTVDAVDAVHARLIEHLKKNLGVTLRA